MNIFATGPSRAARIAALGACGLAASLAAAQLPDPAVLDRAGELAYTRALKASAPRGGPPPHLPAAANRVKTVVNRLVVQTTALDVPRRGYSWAFTSLPAETPRFDIYPGGRMIVNAGWIERLRISDDELGAILAHMLAHLVLGQADARAVALAGDFADPDPNRVVLRLANAIEKSVKEPWTAEQEREADQVGVQLAARAGYDPRAAITFWHKVDTAADRTLIELHPMDAARVAALEAQMPAALQLFAQARASAVQEGEVPLQIRRKAF